jgi:hypothetical protein
VKILNEIVVDGNKTKKRTFLGLSLASLFLIITVIIYFFIIAGKPDAGLMRNLAIFVISSAFLFSVLILCGLFCIVLAILGKWRFPGFSWFVGQTLFLYPFVLQIGRFLSITQDKIQRSFIEVNNQLLSLCPIQAEAARILVLLPHCLQYDGCTIRITHNIENCKRCGRCQIASLLEVTSKRGIPTRVVTGGTLARRAVETHRPKIVVAVACERDLSSGVIDTFPLPVFGILNERPQGPCFNTRVDLQKVENALDFFLGQGKIGEEA